MPKTTVVISFYNKVEYLKLVLAGFETQSHKDFDIIISDDGSRSDVIEQLMVLIAESPLKISHIWQEDKGFRKNMMLNKSTQMAQGDYLIFVDADCIPHHRFVEEHLQHAQRGVCLTGRRVNLSERITQKLTVEKIKIHYLEKIGFTLFFDQLFGKSSHVERGWYFQSKWMRAWINSRHNRGILGCNFSIFKEDLLKVNGFDERYVAPSIGEDSDLQFRLELANIQIKTLFNIANQYHLYHKLLPRTVENEALFEQTIRARIAYTPFGITKQASPQLLANS